MQNSSRNSRSKTLRLYIQIIHTGWVRRISKNRKILLICKYCLFHYERFNLCLCFGHNRTKIKNSEQISKYFEYVCVCLNQFECSVMCIHSCCARIMVCVVTFGSCMIFDANRIGKLRKYWRRNPVYTEIWNRNVYWHWFWHGIDNDAKRTEQITIIIRIIIIKSKSAV